MTNVGDFFLFIAACTRGVALCVVLSIWHWREKRLKYSGSRHNLILISPAMDSPQHHAGDV